jgi:DNA-directed RNA polymerase specialized sigma24 family protein
MSRDGEYLGDLIRFGDPDTIARELYPIARRMAATLVRNSDPHLLDTATHDAILAVCRYRHTYRAESKVTTWLYRIACRAALRCARQSRRWYDHHLRMPSECDCPPSELDPGLAPSARVSVEALAILAMAVPNRDWRRVWLLWNEPGAQRTHEEVGRLTGYTAGSVAATLSKVRGLLASGV